MRGSRKFCQRGPTLTSFFFKFDEGRKDPNTTISGPSTVAGHLNGVSLADP